MFTGIIEESGEVRSLARYNKGAKLTIGCKAALEGTRLGDSIAVNGVCLTADELGSGSFTAYVMEETLRRSNLGMLRRGDKVNLERAMAANGRFGGHIVAGHIDGVGTIEHFRCEGDAVWVTISADSSILRYIVEKGSIAVDGISLTVASVDDRRFEVSLIPHTGANTTLLDKRTGEKVNLECDVIGKYVEKLIGGKTSGGISMDFLIENGF